MYKLVVGLGNPQLFHLTRHNVGKQVLDFLTGSWQSTSNGHLSVVNGVTLFKSKSFMNICGSSIKTALSELKFDLKDIIILHDDIELGLGKVKLRTEGSAKGHNGIRSLINSLGTDKFQRLRIGIGRPNNSSDVPDYVLSNFTNSEKILLKETVFPQCIQILGLKKETN